MHRLSSIGVFTMLCCGLVAQTNFPSPPVSWGNPVTPNKVLLGMALFFEEQLSSTSTVACATCHDLSRGGVDRRAPSGLHPGADGVFGTTDDTHASVGVASRSANGMAGSVHFGFGPQVTKRRAPTVINAGYQPSLFYDGRAENTVFRDPLTNQTVLSGPVALENVVLGPPLDPVEMGHEGRTWNDVVQKLAVAPPLYWASQLPPRLQTFVQGRTYPQLFQQAFGTPAVTPVRIAMALATYLRTLNSDQTLFDRHLAGTYTLDATEMFGLQLFRSPRLGANSCSTCHGDFESRVRSQGPIVGQLPPVTQTGSWGSSVVGARLLFHNTGVRPSSDDPGRGAITNVTADVGMFRVANLRNVELSGPYFHNGSAATLLDVIDFYDRGGDYPQSSAANLLPRHYSSSEKGALIAILRTLTDLRLARGQMPFDRPVLGSENGRLVTPFGTVTHANRRPVIGHAPQAPAPGATDFRITLSGVSAGTFTLLMWSTETMTPIPQQHNLALAFGPSFQCFAVGPAQPLLGMPQNGAACVTMPLPSDPSYHGFVLYAQWLALEPSAGLVTSNGLRLELQ